MRLTWQRILATLIVLTGLVAPDHAFGGGYSFDPQKDFLTSAEQWPAWQQTLNQQRQEMDSIRNCLLEAPTTADLNPTSHDTLEPALDSALDSGKTLCSKRYKSLRRLLLRAQNLTDRQKVELVNRYVNRYRYRRDRTQRIDNKVLRNNWQTLAQFLSRGGDCEDYATAKYFILREMGFSADALRIVVGWERTNRSHHALLAVNLNDRILFLESDNTIKAGRLKSGFRFTYSLNESGIWDHKMSSRKKGSI